MLSTIQVSSTQLTSWLTVAFKITVHLLIIQILFNVRNVLLVVTLVFLMEVASFVSQGSLLIPTLKFVMIPPVVWVNTTKLLIIAVLLVQSNVFPVTLQQLLVQPVLFIPTTHHQLSSAIVSVQPHVLMDTLVIFRVEHAENVIQDAWHAQVSEIAQHVNITSTFFHSTTTKILHVCLNVQ